MTSYLLAPAVAVLEILVSQQVPGERSHRLNVASGDFIQIFKLLRDQVAGLNMGAFNHHRVANRVGGENVLLHY